MKLFVAQAGISRLFTRKYTLTEMAYVATVFCLALACLRMYYANSYSYLFMIWNLLLGYVPFIISNVMALVPVLVKRWWLLLPAFALWLLFLPNAPYMITDLFHLAPFEPVPQWFDLFTLCAFAYTGVLVGYLSLAQMKHLLQQRFEAKFRGFSLVMIWLCALGVYIGRYLRWNSWDLLTRPVAVLTDVFGIFFRPTHYPGAWGFTLCMGVLMCLFYYTAKKIPGR